MNRIFCVLFVVSRNIGTTPPPPWIWRLKELCRCTKRYEKEDIGTLAVLWVPLSREYTTRPKVIETINIGLRMSGKHSHYALGANTMLYSLRYRFKINRDSIRHLFCYRLKLTVYIKQQEVLGSTNRLLSLTRHGPHWKRRVQQFLYCCLGIRYRGNVSTELLPSNDTGLLLSRCLATIRGFLPSVA
jgi:hypothetical protein